MVHRLLQERVAPSKDAATHRSYLENIAEHREIVRLYEGKVNGRITINLKNVPESEVYQLT